MTPKLTGEGGEDEVKKKPLQFSAINTQLLLSIDMKTKVVQYVPRINIKYFFKK